MLKHSFLLSLATFATVEYSSHASSSSVCVQEVIMVDFNTFPNGTSIPRGTYVNDEWKNEYGMELFVVADDIWSPTNIEGRWWAPDGKSVRIFDTAHPGSDFYEGDVDLGSPNEECVGGGPGQGTGGIPNALGENCTPLGNVIVIQESRTGNATADPYSWIPDDSSRGGSIWFTFDPPAMLDSFGVFDVDDDDLYVIEVTYADESKKAFTFVGLGNNGAFNVPIMTSNVVSAEIMFQRSSGSISFVQFGHEKCEDVPPTANPTAAPTPNPTVTPSKVPSAAPSLKPSADPTITPTIAPTKVPSAAPSFKPSTDPTITPTVTPTTTPSFKPSANPTIIPAIKPTKVPSVAPSFKPSADPTITPTVTPTTTPSFKPSTNPTIIPAIKPTKVSSTAPSFKPSANPTITPTVTSTPTKRPSAAPSRSFKPSFRGGTGGSMNHNKTNKNKLGDGDDDDDDDSSVVKEGSKEKSTKNKLGYGDDDDDDDDGAAIVKGGPKVKSTKNKLEYGGDDDDDDDDDASIVNGGPKVKGTKNKLGYGDDDDDDDENDDIGIPEEGPKEKSNKNKLGYGDDDDDDDENDDAGIYEGSPKTKSNKNKLGGADDSLDEDADDSSSSRESVIPAATRSFANSALTLDTSPSAAIGTTGLALSSLLLCVFVALL